MKILICSDGHAQADNAIRFASEIAIACQARVTLLGIVELPRQEAALQAALRTSAQIFRDHQLELEIITKHGRPAPEISKYATELACDLVVIGAERKGRRGPFSLSAKAYDIVKALAQPVLVVIGAPVKLQRILLCSGGQAAIQKAVDLAAQIAAPLRATVSILNVLAEPPAVYSALIAEEENVGKLLESNSVLGRNLRAEKETFGKLGVNAEVRVRHGLVVPEIFKEIETGGYDLIVAGASEARGTIGTYLLGDVTRKIIDRAASSVLVVRGTPGRGSTGSWLGRLSARLLGK